MTKQERIRNMSIEEMARFIHRITRGCNQYDCENCPIGDENCPDFQNDLEKWLESEVEE